MRRDEKDGVDVDRLGRRLLWSVTLPIDLVSMNVLMRWHYRKLKEWKTSLEQYIFVLGRPLPKFPGPVGVHIHRMYGHRKREFDEDNLYAAAKPILDAMKEPRARSKHGLGIIQEDNPRACKLVMHQSKSPDKSTKVVISVLDLCNSDDTLLSDWVGSIQGPVAAAPGSRGIRNKR